ncbi:MAG: hypothetical protein GTO29_11690 [Candidatus Latescibacteria bacterium]|nr:hypothetical protein [Candidatus Latescibacterota bacterium]NIO56828.1 hypothetical protein [Candidatus Latescibacterota bacterium]
MEHSLLKKIKEKKYLYIIVFVVGIFSLIKGFAIHPHPYALSQYLYTYEGGFLVRGLLGQTASLLFDADYVQIKKLVEIISICFVLLFFVAINLTFLNISNNREENLLLFLIIVSGPLLVSIGSTRGYHDALMLSLGLFSYNFFVDKKYIISIILLSIAILIHEIVTVYILPLLALHLIDYKIDPLRKIITILFITILTITVLIIGKADNNQVQILKSKIAESTSVLSNGWEGYQKYGPHAALRKPPSHWQSLRFKERLMDVFRNILHKRNASYLSINIVLIILGIYITLKNKSLFKTIYILALFLSPHIIHLIAWDSNRFLSLSTLTSCFILLHLINKNYGSLKKILRFCAPVLVIIQICTDYDVIEQYAGNETLLRAVLSVLR